jgi:hypothetical protein
MMVFSTAALVVGLVHLAGLALSWRRLGAPDRMELPPSESSDKSASL